MTCDAKGAIDMEIAFEQSKHEVSNTTKGCTDIPPVPNWDKPDQTENWDNEDEHALPVLKPNPLTIPEYFSNSYNPINVDT
ncbi:hypothetical protein LOD99_13595 [Oopsacas minuta]|uniref:Uncharacterized protein n=1 Tax=Oopsacas minuta TaxID=111878 RepID=A0AAV7KIC6_9METZ|nr:hypothetical protein LOD99_13595 [Oopsacas minuta]